jgi:hypothetical protein
MKAFEAWKHFLPFHQLFCVQPLVLEIVFQLAKSSVLAWKLFFGRDQ